MSQHFLNISKNILAETGQLNKPLSSEELGNMALWESSLEKANSGILLNLITVRNPTRMGWSDSCPFGICGYVLSGKTWRIKVPNRAMFHGDNSVNNLPEFLGMAINVLLVIEEAPKHEEAYPCILTLGDDKTAISWIFKSGRINPFSNYFMAVCHISRTLAMNLL